MQRPKREKVALVGIFSLGVFSCVASIVRLHSIRIYTESKDPFFDSVPINLWSMVEVTLGILCASIPSLKALFSKAQRERTQNGTYQYHGTERSGIKPYGKNGGSGSGTTVINAESYGLKDVERGEQFDSRKEALGRGAWLATDSEGNEHRIVSPESRV